MTAKNILTAGTLTLGCVLAGLGGLAPARADHRWRQDLNRYFDQQRREVHDIWRGRFEQMRWAHEARRDSLRHQWQRQREFLRGEARAHFDRDYHRQRQALERHFNDQVRALNRWRDDEVRGLSNTQRYERERLQYRERRVERHPGDDPVGWHTPPFGRSSLHLNLGNFRLGIPLGSR